MGFGRIGGLEFGVAVDWPGQWFGVWVAVGWLVRAVRW